LPTIPASANPGQDRVVILIVKPDDCLRQAIERANAAFPWASIIVAGIGSSQTTAIQAFRAGADDFIPADASERECAAILDRFLASSSPLGSACEDQRGLVGDSAAMQELRAYIRKLAPTPTTVLITGETGTGKEVAAAQLHRLSRRAKGPLVALNCAAIPEALVEGELFGFERGSFSGAVTAYPGKLRLADGGTLFLDEVGELSLAIQAKVLRAIESREIYRLGGRAPVRFDVRIIVATNRDLAQERDAGRFREDLFYRLAVARVHMPPLRDHLEDIGPIARALLHELAETSGRTAPRIDAGALAALQAHDWPGNVRELRNVLEVALIDVTCDRIRRGDILPALGAKSTATRPQPARLSPKDERERLLKVLSDTGGNKTLAAQALNCSRMTLYRKLTRYGLVNEVSAAGCM
jgi:DNA-binding NtrC family response regulator